MTKEKLPDRRSNLEAWAIGGATLGGLSLAFLAATPELRILGAVVTMAAVGRVYWDDRQIRRQKR